MQGHYNITLAKAGKYSDDQWRAALRDSSAKELADETGVVQEIDGHNLIFGRYAPYIFDHCFKGPTAPDSLDISETASAALALIQLNNVTSEPAYDTDVRHLNVQASQASGATPYNDTTNFKRFIEDDDVAHEIISDPSGRNAVLFRSKFLWTTSQGNTNDIYSFAVWHGGNADNTTYDDRQQIGRIRLKDQNDTPTVLVKTSSEVLLVEYTFTLTSI